MEHQDPWLDLIERFAARGTELRMGDMIPCMVRHLLDVVEEQAVRIDGLEAKLARLRTDLGDAPRDAST